MFSVKLLHQKLEKYNKIHKQPGLSKPNPALKKRKTKNAATAPGSKRSAPDHLDNQGHSSKRHKVQRCNGQLTEKHQHSKTKGISNVNKLKKRSTSSLASKRRNRIKKLERNNEAIGVNINKSKQRTASTLITMKKKKAKKTRAGKITGLVAPNKGKKEMNRGSKNRSNKDKASSQEHEGNGSIKKIKEGMLNKPGLLAPNKGKKGLSEGDRELNTAEAKRRHKQANALFYKEGGLTHWNSSNHDDFVDEWNVCEGNISSKTEMENSFAESELNGGMVTVTPGGKIYNGKKKGKKGLKVRKKQTSDYSSDLVEWNDNVNSEIVVENAVSRSEAEMVTASGERTNGLGAVKESKGCMGSKAERKGKAKQKTKKHEQPTAEQENTHYSRKRHMVGEPLGVISTREDNVIAALAPGKSLYLQGVVSIQVLIGSVQVLGYTIKEGEAHTVYSLPSAALLGIKPVDVRCLEPSEPLLKSKGVPSFWIQGMMDKQGDGISVVEFEKVSPPAVLFLKRIGWKRLLTFQANQEPWARLGASLVKQGSCDSFRLTQEGPDWHDIIHTINTACRFGNTPRVVVCGGKGVGKSTFFRHLANSLVTTSSILCLDLDPGQPEFSLPTCLSLIKLNKPLLGPPHIQRISDIAEVSKQVVVGDIRPQFMLQRYMAGVELLHKMTSHHPNLPLLVNTMGWVEGTGLAINVDVIRIVQPTHLVQINSHTAYRNFPMDMTMQAVKQAKECIITRPGETELHYSFTTLRSVTSAKGTTGSFQPRELRELRVLNEVSHLIQGGLGGASTIVIPWYSVALHVCGEQIPRERILQVVNGQLVALCHVSPDFLETVRPDLPKHLQEECLGNLLCWGIISGINPVARELHILTSASPSANVRSHVNAVILPRLQLPPSVYKLFASGEAPYLQSAYEHGKPKLRVDRQLKPRGRRDARKK